MKERADLTNEAIKINGRYIEDIIPHYVTQRTTGRKSLRKELSTDTVGSADGEQLRSSRFPSREINVEYFIYSYDEDEIIDAFNQLNNLLNIEETDFVFNDEPNMFYTGTAVMDGEVTKVHGAASGSFTIYCSYPFKRSTTVTTLSSTDASGVVVDNTSATFTFKYKGTQPARPILRAKFASALSGGDYSEDGDCGFVAFLDADENIIQLGNPNAVDLDQTNKNTTLINQAFNSTTGWTASGITVGSITDTYWNKGAGQTQNYAKGVGTLSRSTTGAVNFNLNMVHRFAVSTSAQTGSLLCYLKNGNDIVVGFRIVKTGNGTSATVEYIINNKVVGRDNIDVSYYNTNFGFCKRDPVYVQETYQERVFVYRKDPYKDRLKMWNRPWMDEFGRGGRVGYYETQTKVRTVQSGYSYTQSNLNSSIVRNGASVTFTVGRLASRTFKRSAIATTVCSDVLLQTTGNINTNAIRSFSFIRKAGVAFADIPNVFTAGDVVEADCNSANVYLYRNGSLDGSLEPQFGALGNDWETFTINPGTNVIRAVWSDWVDTDYKPTIEIDFNEVYL